MARGRFELPASRRGGPRDYRERLDSVRGFVAERAVLHAPGTPRPTLYKAYGPGRRRAAGFPVSAVTLNDHLRRGFAGQIEERTRHGIRGWSGIGLREGTS